MDFKVNTKKVNPILPSSPPKNNRQNKEHQHQYIFPKKKSISDDQYMPTIVNTPNTLYDNHGVVYAKHEPYPPFVKRLEAVLEKEIPLEDVSITNVKSQEYARAYLPIQDLYEYDFTNNRFKYLLEDINQYMDNDIRGTMLIAPAYGSDNSYSSYINGNPRSEMYQKIFNNKPYQVIHTLKDLHGRYFEPDTYTSIKPGKI